MRRFWWSSLMLCTAAIALVQAQPSVTITGPQGPAQFSPSARRPGLIDPTCGLVGGPAVASLTCDSQGGREWEGLASTDYFTIEPLGAAPNPDIAVGPDDILTIVNRSIARYPNPNAPSATNNNGTASVDYNPSGTYYFPPTSRNFLDVWLGEAALLELCPTLPRSNATCVIDNASVRYDQMQGRFVVLFTVVDNALINCYGCLTTASGANAGLTRKASWVMIISRWATGCQGSIGTTGVNIGGACTPNTTPAVPGLVGNTTFFTTPQPPGPAPSNPNSGGWNTNWMAYYGTPDGTSATSCGTVGPNATTAGNYGNINCISDARVATQQNALAAQPRPKTIDCRNSAVAVNTLGANNATSNVCYFPTSARLGIDNDNIYIVSSVINDNINPPAGNREWILGGPPTFPNLTQESAAFEGTRLRVHKKAAFYAGLSSLPGSTSAVMAPGASQLPTRVQGDFYDLWGSDNPGTPFTFDRTVNQPLPGGASRDATGLHYEPEHVRGRSLASFNGNANSTETSDVLVPAGASQRQPFYTIWGAIDQPPGFPNTHPPQNLIYHREVAFTHMVAGSLGANATQISAVATDGRIRGGIPVLRARQGHVVPAFTNPNAVIQRDKLVQPNPNAVQPTPRLYVGDNRPHRVISREGHHYIARVGQQTQFSNFPGQAADSTVIYDIVQKLAPAAAGNEVYNTAWGNGNFYSPMFDTPANVAQYGAISPINVQPFLEKLFVGTTYHPLSPSDPRTFSYGLISNVALIACKGQEPSTTTNSRSYPGLYDIRCGEDAYDSSIPYQHPTTGSYTPTDFRINLTNSAQLVPFGIRGGAATDPNNMGLWLYGAYAKARLASVPGFGQWGTYVSHYPLTFPLRDPYNNTISSYSDVPPGHPFFVYIQIAKQTEIEPGSRAAATFNPDGTVTRQDMAKWVVRSMMDEPAITNYLNSTGGVYCSFADAPCPNSSGQVTDTTGTTGWRYIELMYRRGITKGCNATSDAQRRFCPGENLTRGQMSAFIIRAKMNTVFPTVTSGSATVSSGCQVPGTQVTLVGDQFGLYTGCNAYFSDVPPTHTFYPFIQKMRELRISNGTSHATQTTPGTYSPDANLTRGQLMTFLIRAFFP